MSDPNGGPFDLGESVWLTVQFANMLYRFKFIMDERLSVDVIVGSAFLNLHVLAILCTEQRICFRNGELPIVDQQQESTDENPPRFL